MLVWVGLRAWQFRMLTRSDALVHFGLGCPVCRGERTRGASLFCGKLRCKDCDHVWQRAERHAVDVAAFD